mgnify:CR=1 FL=1
MIEYTGIDEKRVRIMEEGLDELPLLKYIGYELVWVERGKAIARVKVDPSRHRNPNRGVNGAVFAAMADTTTAFAAYSCGTDVCTVSDENQYLHAGRLKGELTCTAQVVKEGRKLIWTEHRICDEKGTLLVKGEYLYYRLDDD